MARPSSKKTAVKPTSKKIEVKKETPTQALSPFEDFERAFDQFFPRGWMKPFHFGQPSWSHLPAPFEGRMPHVDVVDRDKEVFVKAELPGVDKNDVEIAMTDRSLTINASIKAEEKEEDGDFHRCEISKGSFSRTISLPSEVDTDKAKAKFKNGVLKITIPKVKKSEHKKIKVS